MSDNDPGIQSDIELAPIFTSFAEGEQNWAIRYGAEPVDAHATGLSNDRGEKKEPTYLNITAGPMGITNHNYIDIGQVDPDGNFEPVKRVYALSIDKDLTMLDPMNSRLVGFVIDGEHLTFAKDDQVLKDDPHHERPNEYQHADVKDTDLVDYIKGDDPSDDYTRIVFQGSERDVLQIYAAMVSATIQINNQDPAFSMFGDLSWKWAVGESPNSNTFNAEMKEVASSAASQLGLNIEEHNPWGLDVGSTPDMLETTVASGATWLPLGELKSYVGDLEKASAEQWKTIQEKGIDVDLDTSIPGVPNPGNTGQQH